MDKEPRQTPQEKTPPVQGQEFRSLREMRELRDRAKSRESRLIFNIRQLMNLLFMLAAIIAVVIYFTNPDTELYIDVCGCAVFFKVVEFVLRYIKK